MKTPLTLFLSGIDTDAGKTYATAYLAKRFMQQGLSVVTQKFIQTGCKDDSEDIIAHRKLMGIDLLPEDKDPKIGTIQRRLAWPLQGWHANP